MSLLISVGRWCMDVLICGTLLVLSQSRPAFSQKADRETCSLASSRLAKPHSFLPQFLVSFDHSTCRPALPTPLSNAGLAPFTRELPKGRF